MKVIIVGGPRRGKSTLAAELASQSGTQVHCTDPASKAKEHRAGTIYLPEGIPFAGDDGAAQWVCDMWFPLESFIVEGHATARALRRWASMHWDERHGRVLRAPADRIIVLDRPAFGVPLPGQERMHKGCMTVWSEIASYYEPLVEYR